MNLIVNNYKKHNLNCFIIPLNPPSLTKKLETNYNQPCKTTVQMLPNEHYNFTNNIQIIFSDK